MNDVVEPLHGEIDTYAMQIGDRTHRICALVLATGIETDRLERTGQIVGAARQVLSQHPIGRRARAALVECSSAAACYINRFAPGDDWEFLGSEVQLGDGRIDLGFRHRGTDQRLIDEIKVGMGRHLDASLRPQVDRYVDAGVEKWGDAFAGVRMCALSAPRTSRLYVPGRKRSILLAETHLMELL